MFDELEVVAEDERACADLLVASVLDERRAAATKLAGVARWADTHPPEGGPRWRAAIHDDDLGATDQVRTMVRGKSRTVPMQVGSDGTPLVSEFAVVELGVLLETTTGSAQAMLRDVLDLRHRLPHVWHALLTGRVEDWRARTAARITRPLTCEQARRVDEEILEALTGLPYQRAVDVIEGRVIAADPAAHEARRQEAAERRYVCVGKRPTPAGLRVLIAQTTAGDIARFDAMVEHVARLLAEAGDTDGLQLRRAKALGILADPAQACLLLAGLEEQDQPVGAAPVGVALRELGPRALDRIRPRTVLYFHLSQEALVARSNLGPVGLEQLVEWLGSDRIVLKPVIDLSHQVAADAYEVPNRIAEHLRLREPFEVFPFGTLDSRRADLDHSRAYQHGSDPPPGQTNTDNLGPIGRRHHNAKTYGGFSCHQPLPGLYLWQLPCGIWYQVDHTGTHRLGRETPEILQQSQRTKRSRAELAWSSTLVAA